MKLLIAIPAFNEEASISFVINQIKSELPNALPLVINDGSSDKTASIAQKAGAAVISMPFNVGVGGAVRVAFKYALENGFDRVLQIDADGQHLPSEAKRLLETVTENGIVVGSRFLDKSNLYSVSWPRRIAMIILATITSKICKTKLTDVTSGFRIASGRAIELFARDYPREYLGDTVESLIIAHRNKIEIREVPVVMKAREHGTPSQNLIKSMWYLIRAILVIALAAIKKSKD
jgi:glycosyltransferase involved in cell wall biosynthesis